MEYCILCNEELIDKSFYENNKDKFDAIPKFKHKEHIIQNAIGGRLKSDNILCEKCGGILNDEIDTDFLKLFLGFTERLKDRLPKERNKKANTPVNGYQVDTKREVVYLDKTITPKKPEFEINEEKKEIKIYANKSIIRNYKIHIANSLKKEGKKIEDYTVEDITQFEDNENIGLFFSEGIENFNEKWKLGFIKIATEFAYLHGVTREQLKRTLDTKTNKIINTDNVIPFFPIGLTDSFIEWHRIYLERNYPTHTLILFTQYYENGLKELLCYVDLFSTFQYYILLNDDYKGDDIFKTYCQKLEKEIKPEINFRQIRLKHLRPVAEDYGINFDFYNGSSIEDLYVFIESEFAKISATYELDLTEELSSTLSNLTTALVLSKSECEVKLENLTEIINSLKGVSDDWRFTIMMELHSLFNPDESVNINRYRQVFVEPDGGEGFETLSTPNEIVKEIIRDKTIIQKYGHMKFGHLAYFAGKQSRTE